MITEDFLLAIGFAPKIMMQLPDWFYLFDSNPARIEVPSFDFRSKDFLLMRIYFSPFGPFGELLTDYEFEAVISYIKLKDREDVIEEVVGHFDISETQELLMRNTK